MLQDKLKFRNYLSRYIQKGDKVYEQERKNLVWYFPF